MKKIFAACIFLFIVLNFGCNSSATVEPFEGGGAEYMPLTIGKYFVYRVDSIQYDTMSGSGVVIDTQKLYFKDVVTDTFRNKEKNLVYSIDHFEKKNLNASFLIKNVYYLYHANNQAYKVDGNVEKIVFPTPFSKGTNWNAFVNVNTFSRLEIKGETLEPYSDKWNFSVNALNTTETIEGKQYTNIARFDGKTNSSNTQRFRLSIEKYAKNIGLVYAENRILDTEIIDKIDWEKKAQKGYILKQYLIEHN
jgi:hypothetical protein